MSDGSRQVQEFAVPHFFEGDDGYEPIDPTLVPSDEEGRWVTESTEAPVSLGPVGDEGGTEQITVDGVQVGFSPDFAEPGQVPVVSGTSAVYDDVAPGIDLAYETTLTGVEETLTLSSADVPTSYVFSMSGGALRESRGGAEIVDDADRPLAYIPSPTVSTHGADSLTDATTASLVRMEVGSDSVTVSISSDWLAGLGPGDFPVVIDPTIQTYQQSSGTASTWLSTSSAGASIADSASFPVGVDSSGVEWRSAFFLPAPTGLPPPTGGAGPWRLFDVSLGSFGCSTNPCPPAYDLNLSYFGDGESLAAPPTFATMPAGQSLYTTAPATNAVAVGQPSGYPSAMLGKYLDSKTGGWVGIAPIAGGYKNCAGQPFRTCYQGTIVDLDVARLSALFYYLRPPPPTSLVAGWDGRTVSTPTPTLVAQVTDDDPQVSYKFLVSTDPEGQAAVADSGWIKTSSWTVPAGTLNDGVKYYVTVLDDVGDPFTNGDILYYCKNTAQSCSYVDDYYVAPAPHGTVQSFTVKLRLGSGGPSPTDTVGAPPGPTQTPSQGAPSPGTAPSSQTVNLVTGDLALKVASGSAQALSGSAGVTLSYDSIQSSVTKGANYGLMGRYYPDSGSHTFTGQPVAQRIEPGVNLSWAPRTESPIGALPQGNNAMLVRWTGFVQLPAGSSWLFGGVHDGGMRVYLDGSSTPVYDSWPGSAAGQLPRFATVATPGGSTLHAIKVEYWFKGDYTTNAGRTTTSAQLWVMNTAQTDLGQQNQFLVPSTWLTPTNSALPPGWSMSPSSSGVQWTHASDEQEQVVLSSPTGDTATFTRGADGAYKPPAGNQDYLALDGAGALRLSTETGQIYTFGADGAVTAVTSAADDRHPAALAYTYSGSPLALTTITDPVSNRSVTITYGGQTGCPTANSAPTNMLCQVTTWAGLTTDFAYNSNGQLAKITATGGVTTLIGYDTDGRVNAIRDALAYDYIAAGQPGSNSCTNASAGFCQFDTEITYDISGRVSTLTQPAPQAYAARPERTYRYDYYGPSTTSVAIAGFNPSLGVAELVSHDDQGRITDTYTSDGLDTSAVWDAVGNAIAVIDKTGNQTSKVYDQSGQATDVYGPAPAACFTGPWPSNSSKRTPPAVGYLPDANPTQVTGCGVTVPHSTAAYDTGINNLGTTYFSNGTLSGAAVQHATGVTAVAGSTLCTTSTALCADWPAGSPPVTSDATGHWSLILAGYINLTTAGAYTFKLRDTQPTKLLIDGQIVAKNELTDPGYMPGQINNASGDITLTTGAHNIQLEFVGSSTQANKFDLRHRKPGATTDTKVLLTGLNPNYGLPTSVSDPDGFTTSTQFTAPGIDPVLRLQTARIMDPSGLALINQNTYESNGPGSYLRRTAITLPAGTTTTFQHYTGTEGPIAAACGVAATTPQGGQVKEKTEPAPATGSARVEQYIYDAAGRAVGARVGTSVTVGTAPWRCSTFDNRGRLTKQTWPAFGTATARTVTYAYAVGGNPLTSSVTGGGLTITSTVDLLGRLVSYTDALGQTTTVIYNRSGQTVETTGPQGTVDNYYHANTGQLVEVDLNGTSIASPTYDTATGRLKTVTYGNGVTATESYDAYGHQTAAIFRDSSSTMVAGTRQTYTLAGRLSTELDYQNGALTNPNPGNGPTYTYDGAGRLATAWLATGQAKYGYANNLAVDQCDFNSGGANTNRTLVSLTRTDSTTVRTRSCFDQADRIVAVTNNANTANATRDTRFTYDDHGNQTADADTTLTFDAADRIASTTTTTSTGSSTTAYIHDALDRVMRRNVNGVTRSFAYGGFSDAPIAIVQGSTIVQRLFALPGGVQLSASATDQIWSYPDLRGNIVATITDSSGAWTHNAYDPWGVTLTGAAPANVSAGSSQGAFGSGAKITDSGSGLVVLGARVYSPTQGRFESVDPVQAGCANAYTYAFGDPLNDADLTGHSACFNGNVGGFALGLAAAGLAVAALITGSVEVGVVATGVGAASTVVTGAQCFFSSGSHLSNCLSFALSAGGVAGIKAALKGTAEAGSAVLEASIGTKSFALSGASSLGQVGSCLSSIASGIGNGISTIGSGLATVGTGLWHGASSVGGFIGSFF